MADLEDAKAAQDRVWDAVVAELSAGRKRSHWMWFVFPQIAGLGSSPTAQRFAIADLAEAEAWLAHPVLGPRLVEAATLMLRHEGQRAEDILGPIDAMKLRSSMTLFEAVREAPPVFSAVIEAFYGGTRCARTEAALRR